MRLRFINSAAMTFFDVRIPGLKMTVVAADGQYVEPVPVDEFRIGVAETYDVIVEPQDDRAYTIFAEAMDRSGFVRATLATREGVTGPLPEMRKPVVERGMDAMGMGHDMQGMSHDMRGLSHGSMGSHAGQDVSGHKGHDMSGTGANQMAGHEGHQMNGMAMAGAVAGRESGAMAQGMDHSGHDMASMSEMDHGRGMRKSTTKLPTDGRKITHGPDNHGPGAAMVAESPQSRLDDPGVGLDNVPHKVLVYNDLRSLRIWPDTRPPERELELHLTGNMERYMWSFDGKKYTEVNQIQFKYNERLRLIMVNDTMMDHPIHLHGMWMELENKHGEYRPRKHTINMKPGEILSALITADAKGHWAFHCHLLYHMDAGMFRVVTVA